jgi:hypothetical protein
LTYVHRTLIVPAALASQAAALCAQLAGPAGGGMFTTGLSATGAAPATHYVSSGKIEDTFAAVLADPAVMAATCQKAGISVTLAACQALLSGSDVSADLPFAAITRLGLKMVSEPV